MPQLTLIESNNLCVHSNETLLRIEYLLLFLALLV